MRKIQVERMHNVNALMLKISAYSRGFFKFQEFVEYGKTAVRFRYADEILVAGPVRNDYRWYGHGMTLSNLLDNFKQYILRGHKLTTLNTKGWGYSDEEVKLLTDYAKQLGIVKWDLNYKFLKWENAEEYKEVEHPELGYVMTYYNPNWPCFSVYTAPILGTDGEVFCYEYDLDDYLAHWVDNVALSLTKEFTKSTGYYL